MKVPLGLHEAAENEQAHSNWWAEGECSCGDWRMDKVSLNTTVFAKFLENDCAATQGLWSKASVLPDLGATASSLQHRARNCEMKLHTTLNDSMFLIRWATVDGISQR